MASDTDEIEQELQALEQRRLTLLKSQRLILRAQRVAAGVCEQLPIRRLERVLKVLRSVRKSQKVTPSDLQQPLFFSQNFDIASIADRMPSRQPRKKLVSHLDPNDLQAAKAKSIELASAVIKSPEEQESRTRPVHQDLGIHAAQSNDSCKHSDNGVPIVPKGRRKGSPPLIRHVHSRKPPNPSLFTPSSSDTPPLLAISNPPRPSPSPSYMSTSSLPPVRLSSPQPILLVLDLNGTLVYRRKGSSTGIPRPSLKQFLNHCLSHHKLLIWSSARPQNVQPLCRTLFSPPGRYKKLVGVWGRDRFGLTAAQYQGKVQVYKDLEVVWKDGVVQASHPDHDNGGRWHQGNTLLLEDNQEKARAQPHNLVEVPEYIKGGGQEGGQEVLAQVMGWIEEARWYADVSSWARTTPFQVNTSWSWDWSTGAPRKGAIEANDGVSTKTEEYDSSQDLDEEDGGVILGMNQLSVH